MLYVEKKNGAALHATAVMPSTTASGKNTGKSRPFEKIILCRIGGF